MPQRDDPSSTFSEQALIHGVREPAWHARRKGSKRVPLLQKGLSANRAELGGQGPHWILAPIDHGKRSSEMWI